MWSLRPSPEPGVLRGDVSDASRLRGTLAAIGQQGVGRIAKQSHLRTLRMRHVWRLPGASYWAASHPRPQTPKIETHNPKP